MTLKELKRRHESGEKQFKSVKAQIREQLKRKCSVWGCQESLAFEPAKRTVCRSDHRKPSAKRKTKAEMRKINREKKKRYEAKHGIVRNKTVRKRDATVSDNLIEGGRGLNYGGQILIYDNYKEPLKEIPKTKGFGYYGTVALTDDKEFVQCHVCGNLFVNVGMHIRKHKISAEKYKETYGLAKSTALMSEPERERLQKNAVKPWDGKLPDHLVEYNRKVQQGLIKHNGNKGKGWKGKGSWSLEKRNKEGLCPDQVLEKIKDLAEITGKTPSYDEFIAHYNYRFAGSIKFQHGSFSAAVKKLGMKTREELRRVDKDSLIEELQEFYKAHKRIPMTSDFNRGLLRNRGTYIAKFGSLNNARIEAGMNAILPMPFGQIMELSPQQYSDYQAGHAVPGKISEQMVKRRIMKRLRRHAKKAAV
jgi:hypothetical protein